MKKCIGCGATLQTEAPEQIGYCKSLEQDYCQRCFRLRHYGDLMIDMKDAIAPKDVLMKIKEYQNVGIVLILDILHLSSGLNKLLFENLKGYPLIVVINKIDLLPDNTNFTKIETYCLDILKSFDIEGLDLRDVILTHHKDQGFKKILMEDMKMLGKDAVLMVGCANVGKSTLLNKLLENTTITTSYYPSTTLDFTSFDVDGYRFIDTPGLVDAGSILMHVPQDYLSKIMIKKTMKPLIFQIYEDQAYFLEGLLRVDVKTKRKGSVIFYLDPNAKIHRTKLTNADGFEKRHFDEFTLKIKEKQCVIFKGMEHKDIAINGLGFISFHHVDEVKVYVPEGVEVKKREVLL